MLSKTYREWEREDDGKWIDPAPTKKRKAKKQRPSKKELLDSLEEHNDGYIPTEVDDLARDE